MTCTLVFLEGNKNDFDIVFDILHKFGELSGCKINGSKPKAFYIVNLRDSSDKYRENKGLTWPVDTVTYLQRWARATSKVAPLPLPLLALKSSVATATRYSSSKVARYRYRYFTTKVAALPATATSYFEQRVNFFRSYL